MDDYHFTNAAREIAKLLEQVSNWYVRRSRERFWSSDMNPEKAAAYETLYEVLTTISQLLAPLTPFIAEDVFMRLTGKSVHLSNYSVPDEKQINELLEKEMDAVLQVVELGRSVRNTTSLKVKQPLASLSLMSPNKEISWDLYEDVIREELNVRKFELMEKEGEFVFTKVKLDFKKSGAKFGKQSNAVNTWLQSLEEKQVSEFMQAGFLEETFDDKVKVLLEDVLIEKVAKEGYASATNGVYTVTLDITLTDELIQEGMAREMIRAVQEYRKKLNLPIDSRVDIVVSTDKEFQEVIKKHEQMLQQNLLMKNLTFSESQVDGPEIEIANHTVLLQLTPAQ